MLDIIVTHYQEPWETGENLFRMINMQRGIRFDDIHVTIVNDGGNRISSKHLKDLKYKVTQIDIPHGGVSVARNTGIEHATEKWIQFCDFDDTYSGVYSLRNILNVMDTNDYDILWGDFYAEDMTKDGEMVLNLRGWNTVFIHGKFFRTEWLKRSGLCFDQGLTFNEDSAFCTIADLMVLPERIGKITCETPIYTWCYREGSATGSRLNKVQAMIGAWNRDRIVTDAFKTFAPKRHAAMVARTVCDAYWMMCVEEVPEEFRKSVDEFRTWYAEHKDVFMSIGENELREVAAASKKEYEISVAEEERRWGIDGKTVHRGIKLRKWLDELEEIGK